MEKFLVEKPKKKLEKTPPRYRFTLSPYISLPTDFLANHSSQAGIIWNHLSLPSPCVLLFTGILGLRSAGDHGVHVQVLLVLLSAAPQEGELLGHLSLVIADCKWLLDLSQTTGSF